MAEQQRNTKPGEEVHPQEEISKELEGQVETSDGTRAEAQLADSGVGETSTSLPPDLDLTTTVSVPALKHFFARQHGNFGPIRTEKSKGARPREFILQPRVKEAATLEEILRTVRETNNRLDTIEACQQRYMLEIESLKTEVKTEVKIEVRQGLENSRKEMAQHLRSEVQKLDNKYSDHFTVLQTAMATENYNLTETIKKTAKEAHQRSNDLASRMAACEVTAAQQRIGLSEIEQRLKRLEENGPERIMDSTRIPGLEQTQPEIDHEQRADVTVETHTEVPRTNKIKLIPPKFDASGRQRPMKFLRELKQYFEVTRPTPAEFRYLMAQCFEKAANEWWMLIEEEVEDLHDLERRFQARYWSEEVQFKARKMLEFGHFNEGTQTTRAEYATRIFGTARDLTPTPSDGEIINALSRHFSEDIRATIIARGIQTLEKLILLLEKFDQAGPINSQRTNAPRNEAPGNNPNRSNRPPEQRSQPWNTNTAQPANRPGIKPGPTTQQGQQQQNQQNWFIPKTSYPVQAIETAKPAEPVASTSKQQGN